MKLKYISIAYKIIRFLTIFVLLFMIWIISIFVFGLIENNSTTDAFCQYIYKDYNLLPSLLLVLPVWGLYILIPLIVLLIITKVLIKKLGKIQITTQMGQPVLITNNQKSMTSQINRFNK